VPGRPSHEDIPATLAVGDVMARELVSTTPAAPLAEVVARMSASGRRALPVVAGGRPIGIITQGDLLARGGLAIRLAALGQLDAADRARVLEPLAAPGRTAATVMTPDPITVFAAAPLREAAERMARQGLKRLPVLGDGGALAGMVSRVDVLRAAASSRARAAGAAAAPPDAEGLQAHGEVNCVMRRDVPVLPAAATLDVAVAAILAARSHRAVVVDAEHRPVGLLSDAELLERLAPPLRRGLFSGRVDGLAFGRAARDATERHVTARTAGELAVEIATAPAGMPLRDAIALVLSGPHRLVAIVDGDGRLTGALDRTDILRGLLLAAR
jgi:CBS-domain-containing membrane protein